MGRIAENLERLWVRIREACKKSGRKAEEIKLVAVSKNFPPSAVLEAYNSGQKFFGENRVQELETKSSALSALPIEWHMVGHIQSNKLRRVIKNSPFIHSIDSMDLLTKAERVCVDEGKYADFLLEVNVSGEESKYGIRSKDEIFFMCKNFASLERMRFSGFMTMAPLSGSEPEQRRVFSALRGLSESAAREFGWKGLELSMGMSSDYVSAILEGATILRIGTMIFGERT